MSGVACAFVYDVRLPESEHFSLFSVYLHVRYEEHCSHLDFSWDFIVLATTVPFTSLGLILTDVPLPSDLSWIV